MLERHAHFWSAAILAVALFGALPAFAEKASQETSFPTRPVRIITAGAGTFHDIATRQLAQQLGERWGRVVVVENQPAAGLTIGTSLAARATPDGYTLLMADRTSLAVAPQLYKGLTYDPVKDLEPITLAAVAPLAIVAHPSLPAGNLQELVEYAKQHPGINYAAAGVGTAMHMAGELFKRTAGVDIVAVQYRGGSAAVTATMGGETKIAFSSLPAVLPLVNAHKLKAYAVTSKARFPGAPDIPTAIEAGLPDFEAEQWIGMLAPSRTPVGLIARLNREIVEILKTPGMRATLLAQGAVSAPDTPAEFAAFINRETAKLKRLIQVAGIRAD
jgi:tripartite-type tricarboxylate transporter receptor subunit TctC